MIRIGIGMNLEIVRIKIYFSWIVLLEMGQYVIRNVLPNLIIWKESIIFYKGNSCFETRRYTHRWWNFFFILKKWNYQILFFSIIGIIMNVVGFSFKKKMKSPTVETILFTF